MLTKKKVKKLTQKMIIASFDKENNLQNKKVKAFVSLIKKFDKMQAILALDNYLKGLKYQMGKTTLQVTSAIPLSGALKKKIENAVKKTNKITSSIFEVDRSLLAGLKLKIADEVINASVKGKIEELKTYGN